MKAAFIGLGVMGFPMAGHLVRTGHDVTVYNRTAEKAQRWVAMHKGRSAPTPAAAAEGADFVFTCVGNDDDLREVTLGRDGAFQAMKKDALFVDHTTVSAEIARELAREAEARGFGFLDAPITGGQTGAERGILSIMVGGREDLFQRAQPVLASYGRTLTHMGPAGAGQLTKMVNQICVAGIAQSVSEALNFGRRAGLDMEKAVQVLLNGASKSAFLDARSKSMLEGRFDFGFAVDWMRKDFGICLAEARRNGAPLPVTALVDQFYARVQAEGGGRNDISSLITLLSR